MVREVVSVVIPTHNREHLVRRAVQSVLAQTYRELDVIVVDDASSDGTKQAIAEIGDLRVRYLRHDSNRGACAARNTGIDAANGDYVALLDSDDEWLPSKLERQIRVFRETVLREVGVVTCGFRSLRRNGHETIWLPQRRGWLLDEILCQRYAGWGPPFLLIKRSVLDHHGLRFDEKLKARQGFDFCARLAMHCQFEFVAEPLVIVHDHDGERVWTKSRAVEASLYLHEKLRAELKARPQAHCRFHFKTAVESIDAQDWSQARKQVLRGIRARPKWPLSYLWLLLYVTSTPDLPVALRRFVLKILGRATFGAFT